VSEWLTFQAILVGPDLPQWGLRFMIPTVGALLTFSAALAAACFVKAYGIAFLGRPRSVQAEQAHEVDRFSGATMLFLAACCFIAGVLPGVLIDVLAPVVHTLIGARMAEQTALQWTSIVPIAQSRSSYDGLLIFLFLLVSGTLTAVFIHRFATRATRRSDFWDCGYPDPSTAVQYSGSSFAMPIRRVFGSTVFLVKETVNMPAPGETRAARFQLKVSDPAWHFLYGPVVRGVLRVSARLNALQFLTIRSYLTLVFATLVLLLLVVAAWR
jgi:hypothetical protein